MKTIEMNKTFTISLILSNLGIHKREKGQGKKLIYVKRKRCVCALEREREREETEEQCHQLKKKILIQMKK